MGALRAGSASPSPRHDPDPILAAASAGDRESVREATKRGEFDDLRSAAYNKTWYISERYCRVGDSVDSFEPVLHDLWYIYYQGGRYLFHESTEHDRLVLDVLRTKGRGPLARPAPSGCGFDIARTPAGALWNDLPFFVTDMTDFWVNDCATMKANERLNFASFLAKLASTRLDKDKLCQIAMSVFRETFETERPLRMPEDTDESPGRIIYDLDIAALLPAACAWIREAGYTIILLSDMSWNDCSSSIGQGGDTFLKSELGQHASAGFSPWRWLYWLKRLHGIVKEAEQAGEKHLAEQATEAIETLLGNVEERNSKILRVFEAADDGLRQDEAFSGLEKLVKGDDSSG